VVILGRDDMRVRIALRLDVGVDTDRHVGAAHHRQAAALAEVVLHVDDHQGPAHDQLLLSRS
jgi:hypothetical protein